MIRHVLSDNGWVELRETHEVTERLRRPVKTLSASLLKNKGFVTAVSTAEAQDLAALAEIPDDKQEEIVGQLADSMGVLADLQDAVAIARIAAWSYGDVVSVDGLLDLPGTVYDEIMKLCAAGTKDLMPDFGPSQDPDSPTGPSTA